MRNLQLTLRYDGTDFNGWQTQPGCRTVQEALEKALAAVTREERIRSKAHMHSFARPQKELA